MSGFPPIHIRLAAELLNKQGEINALKASYGALLVGVEVVLLDHASELAGACVDPNLAELACRYLAVVGDAAPVEIRNAMEAAAVAAAVCPRCGGDPCSECGECPRQGCWDCRCGQRERDDGQEREDGGDE